MNLKFNYKMHFLDAIHLFYRFNLLTTLPKYKYFAKMDNFIKSQLIFI
jgi:hypothetical protein